MNEIIENLVKFFIGLIMILTLPIWLIPLIAWGLGDSIIRDLNS